MAPQMRTWFFGPEAEPEDEESSMAVETQPHVIRCISGLVPPDE